MLACKVTFPSQTRWWRQGFCPKVSLWLMQGQRSGEFRAAMGKMEEEGLLVPRTFLGLTFLFLLRTQNFLGSGWLDLFHLQRVDWGCGESPRASTNGPSHLGYWLAEQGAGMEGPNEAQDMIRLYVLLMLHYGSCRHSSWGCSCPLLLPQYLLWGLRG